MCNFCETKQEEYKDYQKWIAANPYDGDEQVDYEGLNFIFYQDKLDIGCQFDGGYIGDRIILEINYCPMCGRKVKS